MANITVTTNQNIIAVNETGGVNVTNTTDTITVLPSGTLIIQGPDTYSINASTATGGANLNLLNSNGTNDAVKIASGTGITVARTDADTITVTNTSPAGTTYTIASAATTGGANLNLVGSDSTTDSVAYKGAGATTVTSTDANTVTITSTDTNTTYTQNASAVSGGANLNLVGSDATTDSIKLASGTNVTVTRTDADTVTIASTDTNTTYTQNISSTSGGANLNLVGSDASTDTVKFADGTGVTVAFTDADTATISIGQSVATTANPTFAGITGGNVTVGIDSDQTISTSSGNLILQTAIGTNAGTLTLTAGVNGSITLVPNGTGNVALTLSNGGNLTNTRNYVAGAIRNATTEAAGDMWSFSSGAGTGYRGLSVDNSTNTAKAPVTVLRSFTGGAVAGNGTTPTVLFERARGTSGAGVTAVQSGDFLGRIVATGANGNATFLGDTVAASPATLTFLAAETFASNTNVGTQMTVALMPTAKTLASVATPTVVLNITPQTTTSRSDSFAWANGNTIANANQNTKLTLDSTGQLIAYGNIATNGTLTFNNELAVNAVTELLDTNTVAGTTVAIQTNYRPSSGSATFSLPQTGWQLGNFRFNSYNTTGGAFALGASVSATATENWTGSANGSSINFFATKKLNTYLTGNINVILASPETTIFKSDEFTFADSAGTDIVGSKIDYNRVYGQFQYDTTVTAVAADTAYVFPLGTADINNIATVGSTSRLIAGAAGIYNLQFSVQVENADNANDHDAYIWLRKNGTDVVGSMGRVTVPKNNAGSLKIIAWNYIVSSANVTDYWEIAYAVSDTDVTFPAFAATAFGPSTATIITSLVPVGA